MLFDGEDDSGLQDVGTAATATLVFLPNDVVNSAKDDCTEEAAAAEAAHGCQKQFDQHKSVGFVKLVCGTIAKIYFILNKVTVDYRLSSY